MEGTVLSLCQAERRARFGGDGPAVVRAAGDSQAAQPELPSQGPLLTLEALLAGG